MLQSKLWPKDTLCITIAANIADTTVLGIEACFPDSIIGFNSYPDKSNVIFLKTYFDYLKPVFGKMSEGIAQSNLNLGKITTMHLKVPTIMEQEKIAEFFLLIDKKVEVQQEKIKKLEELKKGMMQKVFSRELRFKDENGGEFGEWEVKRIGDVTTVYSGGTPNSKNPNYYKGLIPFIRSGEIHTSQTALFINEEGLNNSSAMMVSKGDLLMAIYGATSGEIAISQIDGAINQAILCLKSNESVDYIKFYLMHRKEDIINTFLQGGQGNLSGAIVKGVKIPLPSIQEQIMISNLLNSIESKINKENKKLEILTEQKKGFMQRMFI